jgi:predicted enzyme related to lactoylglutathione lyase
VRRRSPPGRQHAPAHPKIDLAGASPASVAHRTLSEENTMTENPVRWFEIYVQDTDRAKKFYEAVFQTRLEKLPNAEIEIWTFPMSMGGAGAPGALVRMEGFPSGGNSTLVYFACDDCAVEAARASQAGGRIQKEKMSIGEYGFIALVFDTEGNMIGLHSMQ